MMCYMLYDHVYFLGNNKAYDNMCEFYEYFNYEPVDPDNVNGMLNYIITERGKAYDHISKTFFI